MCIGIIPAGTSPYVYTDYDVCYVYNGGGVGISGADDVHWGSCGVYFFRYFYREIIEFSSSSPERREFSLL